MQKSLRTLTDINITDIF